MPSEYNTPPEGWREITPEQFAGSWFFLYGPEMFEQEGRSPMPYEFRQFKWEGQWISAYLFHLADNTGYGLVDQYGEQSMMKGGGYAHKLRIFKFGCEHEWGPGPKVPFLHSRKCTKCGFVWTYDSSG